MGPVNRIVEPQTVGDLLVARIPQHRVAAADQHRHVGGAHMKAIEEILRVGVAIEVDVMKRVAIARQELLDAQRAGAMGRANQDDVAVAACNQLDAAEDERPHEDVAQLGIRLDQSEQLLAIELDHLARLADPRPRQRSPAGQHGAFAGELPGPVRDDQRFRSRGWPQHLHLAAQHDEERHRPLAHLDEHVAGRDRAPSSMGRDAFDLCRRERRKDTIGRATVGARGVRTGSEGPIRVHRSQLTHSAAPSASLNSFASSAERERERLHAGSRKSISNSIRIGSVCRIS